MKSKLRVAGCQFAVAGDIEYNRQQILGQIDEAAAAGARIVQFPEAALSGYASVDVPDFSRLDWEALRRATDDICRAAASRKVWNRDAAVASSTTLVIVWTAETGSVRSIARTADRSVGASAAGSPSVRTT